MGRLDQVAHGLAEEAPVYPSRSKVPANATDFSSNQYEKREDGDLEMHISFMELRYLVAGVGRNNHTVVGSDPVLLVLIDVKCSHHYVNCCQS